MRKGEGYLASLIVAGKKSDAGNAGQGSLAIPKKQKKRWLWDGMTMRGGHASFLGGDDRSDMLSLADVCVHGVFIAEWCISSHRLAHPAMFTAASRM